MSRYVSMIALAAALAIGTSAHAVELVTNGGFEENAGVGQINTNTSATGWTVPGGGYTFLFTAATAGTGVTGQFGSLSLWTTSNSGLGTVVASQDGGYFIGSDGAFQQEPIQQTINGLVNGKTYRVTFDYAAAQQSGFTGNTTEGWQVSLGSETHTTTILHNPSHDFTPWTTASFAYTATGPSEVLSFLALGTPNGEPPFSLLDGVSLTAVPEPGTWAMMILGVGAIGAVARRRRAAAVAHAPA